MSELFVPQFCRPVNHDPQLPRDLLGLFDDFLFALATGRPLYILVPSRVVLGLRICVEATPAEYFTYIFQNYFHSPDPSRTSPQD